MAQHKDNITVIMDLSTLSDTLVVTGSCTIANARARGSREVTFTREPVARVRRKVADAREEFLGNAPATVTMSVSEVLPG